MGRARSRAWAGKNRLRVTRFRQAPPLFLAWMESPGPGHSKTTALAECSGLESLQAVTHRLGMGNSRVGGAGGWCQCKTPASAHFQTRPAAFFGTVGKPRPRGCQRYQKVGHGATTKGPNSVLRAGSADRGSKQWAGPGHGLGPAKTACE